MKTARRLRWRNIFGRVVVVWLRPGNTVASELQLTRWFWNAGSETYAVQRAPFSMAMAAQVESRGAVAVRLRQQPHRLRHQPAFRPAPPRAQAGPAGREQCALLPIGRAAGMGRGTVRVGAPAPFWRGASLLARPPRRDARVDRAGAGQRRRHPPGV